MKLKQGQIWVKGAKSYRITEWARMTIQYKYSNDSDSEESEVIEVSKKDFCRLIKGAVLQENKD